VRLQIALRQALLHRIDSHLHGTSHPVNLLVELVVASADMIELCPVFDLDQATSEDDQENIDSYAEDRYDSTNDAQTIHLAFHLSDVKAAPCECLV